MKHVKITTSYTLESTGAQKHNGETIYMENVVSVAQTERYGYSFTFVDGQVWTIADITEYTVENVEITEC